MEVSNKTNARLNLVVFSLTGQKVMEEFISAGGKLQKQLTNIKGSYILNGVAGDGSTYTRKFIISD